MKSESISFFRLRGVFARQQDILCRFFRFFYGISSTSRDFPHFSIQNPLAWRRHFPWLTFLCTTDARVTKLRRCLTGIPHTKRRIIKARPAGKAVGWHSREKKPTPELTFGAWLGPDEPLCAFPATAECAAPARPTMARCPRFD